MLISVHGAPRLWAVAVPWYLCHLSTSSTSVLTARLLLFPQNRSLSLWSVPTYFSQRDRQHRCAGVCPTQPHALRHSHISCCQPAMDVPREPKSVQNRGRILHTKFNKNDIYPEDNCCAESRTRRLLVGTPGPPGASCNLGLFLVPKGAAAISLHRLEPRRSQKQIRAPRGTWVGVMLCPCKHPVPLRGQR